MIRKSPRIEVKIPIVVSGFDEKGEFFEEKTQMYSLSKFGAGVFLKNKIGIGKELAFIALPRGARFKAKVVWSNGVKTGVEFLEGVNHPWRTYFPEPTQSWA